MADCHAGLLPLLSGLKLCRWSFFKCVFSPHCLSLFRFNKLISCQLLTDPTLPESVVSVKGP